MNQIKFVHVYTMEKEELSEGPMGYTDKQVVETYPETSTPEPVKDHTFTSLREREVWVTVTGKSS